MQEQYTIPVIDDEYWSEILGDDEDKPAPHMPEKTKANLFPSEVKCLLPIKAQHQGRIYQAELLNKDGQVHYLNEVFNTPTGAAKMVATDWKAVNGRIFCRTKEEALA